MSDPRRGGSPAPLMPMAFRKRASQAWEASSLALGCRLVQKAGFCYRPLPLQAGQDPAEPGQQGAEEAACLQQDLVLPRQVIKSSDTHYRGRRSRLFQQEGNPKPVCVKLTSGPYAPVTHGVIHPALMDAVCTYIQGSPEPQMMICVLLIDLMTIFLSMLFIFKSVVCSGGAA